MLLKEGAKMIQKILALIKQREGIKIEFKECKNTCPKSVFETVCSFLNRYGGDILLGVEDDGNIIGVNKDSIEQIKKDFITVVGSYSSLGEH